MVTREALEASLQGLRREVRDPREGLFGPESKVWELIKESVIFLGGGRAALLQLAHPYVAHAIDQHSKTRDNPQARFNRTFFFVFDMVFGDLQSAFKAARRVHRIHERIQGQIPEASGALREGSHYMANKSEALFWVHATLMETTVQMYELIVHPLSLHEKNLFYEESKRFAALFGIDERVIPPDWRSFVAYNRQMWESELLHVGTPAKEIGHFLFLPSQPVLQHAMKSFQVFTAGLLPARLREAYGFRYGMRERALFRATVRVLRRSYRQIPRRLRYLPAYLEASRKLDAFRPSDRAERLAHRFGKLVLDTLIPSPA